MCFLPDMTIEGTPKEERRNAQEPTLTKETLIHGPQLLLMSNFMAVCCFINSLGAFRVLAAVPFALGEHSAAAPLNLLPKLSTESVFIWRYKN